jgi:hypothetical protein
MKRRLTLKLLLLAAASTALGSPLAASASPGGRVVPGLYRGKLGELEIEMRLELQENEEDSVQGSYIVFGQSDRILFVGEFEAGELVMEESVNGTDVSGSWSGRIRGDVIAGQWTDADGGSEKDFEIHRIGPLPKS